MYVLSRRRTLTEVSECVSLLPLLCIAVYPDRVSSRDGFIPDDRFMTVCQKASRGSAVTARVCACVKEGNMFLKGTHSHPNNTGVDLENTAAGHFIYLLCPPAYLLSHQFIIIHRHLMAAVSSSLIRKKTITFW